MEIQEKNFMETKRHLKNILLHNNQSYYQFKKQDISSSSNDSLFHLQKNHSNSFILQNNEQQLAEIISDSRDQDRSLNILSLNELLLKHEFNNIKHLKVSQQSYEDAIDSFQNDRISNDKQRKRISFIKQQPKKKAKIKKNINKTNFHQDAFNLKYQNPIPVCQQHIKRCYYINNLICQENLIKKNQLRNSDSEWNKQLSNILLNRQNSQKYIEFNGQLSFLKKSQIQKQNDRKQTEKNYSKIYESKQEKEKENILIDQLTTFRKHVKKKSQSRLKNYQNINPYKNYVQWKQNEQNKKQQNLQSLINKLFKEGQQQSGQQNQLQQSIGKKNQRKSEINQLSLEIRELLKLDLSKTQQNIQTKQQQHIQKNNQSEILEKEIKGKAIRNRLETSLKHGRRRRRIFQNSQNLSRSKVSNQQKKYKYEVSNKYRKQCEVNYNQIQDKIVKFGPTIKYRQLECCNQIRSKSTHEKPKLMLQKVDRISKLNIKLQNYIGNYGYR